MRKRNRTALFFHSREYESSSKPLKSHFYTKWSTLTAYFAMWPCHWPQLFKLYWCYFLTSCCQKAVFLSNGFRKIAQNLIIPDLGLYWTHTDMVICKHLSQCLWAGAETLVRKRARAHTHSTHIHPHTSCHWANWAIKRPFWPMSLAIEQLSPPHSLLSSDWFMCACLQEQDLWFPTVPRIIYNTLSTPEFMPCTPRRSISWSWSPTNNVREYESLHP